MPVHFQLQAHCLSGEFIAAHDALVAHAVEAQAGFGVVQLVAGEDCAECAFGRGAFGVQNRAAHAENLVAAYQAIGQTFDLNGGLFVIKLHIDGVFVKLEVAPGIAQDARPAFV